MSQSVNHSRPGTPTRSVPRSKLPELLTFSYAFLVQCSNDFVNGMQVNDAAI